MSDASEKLSYVWLVQDIADGASADSEPIWRPLSRTTNDKLESALASEKVPDTLAINQGRYDVDLKSRKRTAAYWDEPEQKVLRSSWFHGPYGEARPYNEGDSELLEVAFQRVISGEESLPYHVELPERSSKVTIELMTIPKIVEDTGVMSKVFSTVGDTVGVGNPDHEHRSIFGVTCKEIAAATARPPLSTTVCAVEDPKHFIAYEAQTKPRDFFESATAEVKPSECVWRGYASAFGSIDYEDDLEADLPENVSCLAFVLHGIGQYNSEAQALRGQPKHSLFNRETSKLQHLTNEYLLYKQQQGGVSVKGRLVFLPLEWYESVHIDAGIGQRLKKVQLPSVPAVRDFANFVVVDVLIYQNPDWQERIVSELRQKMDRLYALFKSRTPEFTGNIIIVGHSLGSVIMFDLMQKHLQHFRRGFMTTSQTQLEAETLASQPVVTDEGPSSVLVECPAPRCCFALGSPLGMFMSMRLTQGGRAESFFRGLDVRWPGTLAGEGWRFFNIFHPDDPIAYRVEPLLSGDYEEVPPKVVPHYGGLRVHHHVRNMWQGLAGMASRVVSAAPEAVGPAANKPRKDTDALLLFQDDAEAAADEATAPSTGPYAKIPSKKPRQGVQLDRLDYVLQESATESMNEFLSALHCHNSYWLCEDLVHFIVDQTTDAIERKARPSTTSKRLVPAVSRKST